MRGPAAPAPPDRQPNYDEVKAVVPVDITENRGAPTSPRAFANAALNSETRVKDSASQEKLSKVAAQLLNIGAWCGTPHGTVFLSSSELAYQWGWGHVCNLAHQNGKAHTAPHLKYVNSENSATIPCVDEVDVVHDLWVRRGKQDKTNYKLLVNEPATHSTMRQSLRLSNDEDTAPRLWRGATDFRSSALPYKENRTVRVNKETKCVETMADPHATINPPAPASTRTLVPDPDCDSIDPLLVQQAGVDPKSNNCCGLSKRVFQTITAHEFGQATLTPNFKLVYGKERLPYRLAYFHGDDSHDHVSLIAENKYVSAAATKLQGALVFEDGVPPAHTDIISIYGTDLKFQKDDDLELFKLLVHRVLTQHLIGPATAYALTLMEGERTTMEDKTVAMFRAGEDLERTYGAPPFALLTAGSKAANEKVARRNEKKKSKATDDKESVSSPAEDDKQSVSSPVNSIEPDAADETRHTAVTTKLNRKTISNIPKLNTMHANLHSLLRNQPTSYGFVDTSFPSLDTTQARPYNFPELSNVRGNHPYKYCSSKKVYDSFKDNPTEKLHEELAAAKKRMKTDPMFEGLLHFLQGAQKMDLPFRGAVTEATTGTLDGATYPIADKMGMNPSHATARNAKLLPIFDKSTNTFENADSMEYNVNPGKPQLFAVLDAAGLLWNARADLTPADSKAPKDAE